MSDEQIKKIIKSLRDPVTMADLSWVNDFDQAQALHACYLDYRQLVYFALAGIASSAKAIKSGDEKAIAVPDMLDAIISIDGIQQAIEDALRKNCGLDD